MSDVEAMIAAWQQGLPGSAWHADAIAPDTAALGQWMQQKLATSGGLKLTRSADPYAKAVRYLEIEGVDVARGLERAEDAHEAGTSRARADAAAITDVALSLKRAERELLAESRGFSAGCTGFTAARLREARERVAELAAELGAACLDDPALVRAARRAAA